MNFKKLLSPILATAMVIPFATAQAASQASRTDEAVFSANNCHDNACAGQFFQVLGMTATEGVIGWGFYREFQQEGLITGTLVKEIERTKAAIKSAQQEVINASTLVVEEERARKIDALRTELSRLKRAADIGDKTTLKVDSETVSDVAIDQEIQALELRNAQLTETLKISPENLRNPLQEQIDANVGQINDLREHAQRIVSYESSTSVEAKVVDIYAKDLQPAIKELERRLARAESLEIVSDAEKSKRLQFAEELLASAKQAAGKTVLKALTTKTVRVVSGAAGVLIATDMFGRILVYLGGKDPLMSPVVKLSDAAVKSFRR